jgi:two-component system response regulator WspF
VKIALVGTAMHQAVRRALLGSQHTLVWIAASGSEALKLFDEARADILLVSAAITGMKPAEFTRSVLVKASCAVVLLTEDDNRRVSEVYEAMGAGAIDVVAAPVLNSQGKLSGAEVLLAKIKTAGRFFGKSSDQLRAVEERTAPPVTPLLVAIGASTGGPQALLTVLSNLPKDLPAAIIIVQHVDSEFAEGLASWLHEGSGIRVDIAKDGAVPISGSALLASTPDHLVMTKSATLRYRAEPLDVHYRPSVDVLFASLAEHWERPGVAVLLTGMGRDGAAGMKKLRQGGWFTIAQDEASSVVYGMPKAAALINAACKILPPLAIAAEVATQVRSRVRMAAAKASL